MARNKHDWTGPTPFGASGKIDKSGGMNWDNPTPNAERDFSGPTPYTHSGRVTKSGGNGIGNPYATAGDRTEMPAKGHGSGVQPAILQSGPEPKNSEPVHWPKRGYSMQVPSTLGGGHMRKPARKIG